MSDGHSGVGMAADTDMAVQSERAGSGSARPENKNGGRTFTPGQKVELAVQVGSWAEGTSGEILGRSTASSPYEWDVRVDREAGAVRVALYEHELREPTASLIERLVSRTSDEWLVGYKSWKPAGDNYFWGGPVIADGEAVGSADGSGTDGPWSVPRDPFGAAVDALYAESEALLLSKNRDYGSRNVSQSPGGPLMGLAVRLHDKLARLTNLLATGAAPEHESLRDTLIDIMGYGAIGVLVTDGAWPE